MNNLRNCILSHFFVLETDILQIILWLEKVQVMLRIGIFYSLGHVEDFFGIRIKTLHSYCKILSTLQLYCLKHILSCLIIKNTLRLYKIIKHKICDINYSLNHFLLIILSNNAKYLSLINILLLLLLLLIFFLRFLLNLLNLTTPPPILTFPLCKRPPFAKGGGGAKIINKL